MERIELDKESKLLLLTALKNGYFEVKQFRELERKLGQRSTPEEVARFYKEIWNKCEGQ